MIDLIYHLGVYGENCGWADLFIDWFLVLWLTTGTQCCCSVMLSHTRDIYWPGHTPYSINKTPKGKKRYSKHWTNSLIDSTENTAGTLCSAPRTSPSKQTPADYHFKMLCRNKAQTPTNGRAHTPPASVHCESVCCCVKASGRAIFSAITAGQSSAVSWVSIGHGSTVHYHMGVATSSLLEKCFQLWSKGGTPSCRHACTGLLPRCVTYR